MTIIVVLYQMADSRRNVECIETAFISVIRLYEVHDALCRHLIQPKAVVVGVKLLLFGVISFVVSSHGSNEVFDFAVLTV